MLLASIAITGLLMGVRYLGVLQPWELRAFDQLMQLRPHDMPDSRILVITVTEEDVKAQHAEKPQGSLSDKSLAQLLEKLEPYQPAAIGLDIYRDYAVGKDYPKLAERMHKSHRLVAVCKVSNPQGKSGVAPPPEVSSDNLGFSDILLDGDRVVRRHYLALTPPPLSACDASYALSVQLALRYLYDKGVELKFPAKDTWQLGKLKFKPLETHTGGYQGIDHRGHQILLNYRSSPSPDAIAPQITLTDVLGGKFNPAIVKDKIVLIGTTAKSYEDYSLTPYIYQGRSQTIPGVMLQAQMVSQLVSAVLDGRPLLWSWPLWGEVIWVWGWSVTGGLLALYLRRPSYLVLAVGVGFVVLYSSASILLIVLGCWIPLVPATLALAGNNIILSTCFNSLSKQK